MPNFSTFFQKNIQEIGLNLKITYQTRVLNAVSRDLHNEPWYSDTGNVVTEYEERFTELGVPICYADVTVPPREDVAEKIRACEERIAVRKKFETEAAERLAKRRQIAK